MAKKPGGNPVTNARRQSRYRERRKPAGLKRQDIGTDQSGFLFKTTPSGAWAATELKQMENVVAVLLTDRGKWENEVVYAELPEYARLIIPTYGKVCARIQALEKDEREK